MKSDLVELTLKNEFMYFFPLQFSNPKGFLNVFLLLYSLPYSGPDTPSQTLKIKKINPL